MRMFQSKKKTGKFELTFTQIKVEYSYFCHMMSFASDRAALIILIGNVSIKFQKNKEKLLQELSKRVKEVILTRKGLERLCSCLSNCQLAFVL